MDSITFCIPYYGKEMGDTDILSTCVSNIRKYYPTNPILICKMSLNNVLKQKHTQ